MMHPCTNHEQCKGFAAGHDRECIECQEARRQYDEEQKIKKLHQKLTHKPRHWNQSKGIAE